MESIEKLDKIKGVMGLVLALSLLIGISVVLVKRSLDVRQIRKDGVYVIGKVISSTQVKNGKSFTFRYYHKGQAFETSLTAPSKKYKEGDLIFIRISSSHPSKSMFTDGKRQPCACFTFEMSPPEGWKEMPLCQWVLDDLHFFH